MQEAPAVAIEGNPCAGVGCTKPASNLSCPTCVKLGITTSKFCDQACFKRNWATHKAVHAKAQQEQTVVVNGVESESVACDLTCEAIAEAGTPDRAIGSTVGQTLGCKLAACSMQQQPQLRSHNDPDTDATHLHPTLYPQRTTPFLRASTPARCARGIRRTSDT